MRLHEEYIRRNKLDIPIIRFDSRSNLFLKNNDTPCNWGILNITWRQQVGKPGFYEFACMEPVHNGRGTLKCIEPERYVYWEQYESEIFRSMNYYKEKQYFVVPSRNRCMMAWEMFLYMFDGWLSEHMDAKFYEYVEKSIIQDSDLNTRTTAYRTASKLIAERFGSEGVMEMLNYQIMPMINGHSQWLEKLFNA